MGYTHRVQVIREIERLRESKLICYLTSLRPNLPSAMADDAIRVFFDHLQALPSRKVERLDIFLCSNGGSGTVPWRLVALFREFSKSFNVLIPYRAYSAASLLALGADEIVMHPFAELGPIDPSVANDFNPIEQGRRVSISVEDVTAYVNFVRETVGITHEDELIKAIEILANKVHPLALGNVERFISQSRMIARKILRTHMRDENHRVLDEIVENMASRLYFHGHPINRREAAEDLGLKIRVNQGNEKDYQLEDLMWTLYRDFEDEFQNREIFDPLVDLLAEKPSNSALSQSVSGQSQRVFSKDYNLLMARVESGAMSSAFTLKRKFILLESQPHQYEVREEPLGHGWREDPTPS